MITIVNHVAKTFNIRYIEGSIVNNGGHNDTGGEEYPRTRIGEARNGSCKVKMDDQGSTENLLSWDNLHELVSPVGAATATVSGDATSYHALIDVEVDSRHKQQVTINWKGTIEV